MGRLPLDRDLCAEPCADPLNAAFAGSLHGRGQARTRDTRRNAGKNQTPVLLILKQTYAGGSSGLS